jgi:hypothetical protein
MAKLKRDKVIEFLKGRGCEELPRISKKYQKFSYPGRDDQFYFVGKAGALRVGKNQSSSFSVSAGLNQIFKKKGVDRP